MNEEHNHIITTEVDTNQNTKSLTRHFPVLTQLTVLAFILLGIFSALLLPEKTNQVVSEAEVPLSIESLPTARPLNVAIIEGVSLRAQAAYVWDIRAQRALFAKNADEVLPLASITKLMTTLVAYELIEDNVITDIPLSAIRQEGSSGLTAGERLSAEKLRKLALISSSNDAAFALAANVGALLGDDEPDAQFVRAMNIRADELGLDSLEYWNPTGLDLSDTKPGAIGNAKDISFLMEYIIANYPEIIVPTQESTTRVYNTDGAYHEISNTNEVALKIPNMIGSKTGYTDLAGGNLTIAFDAGFDRPVIITILGSTRDERFTDVLTLVDAVQATLGNTK